MKPRALLFWPHLATGSVAGLVILTMSVTGIALAYRGEVTAWAEREYRVSPAGRPRLSVESLLRAVRALADSAPLSSVVESADPEAPVVLGFGRERVVLVDPYTGGDLGPGAEKTRAFFRFVEGVHRRLGFSSEKRAFGEAVAGAGTLAFLGPGGSAGQGLEALVSLNGALLVGTGLSLAWQRLRSWSAARKRSTRSLESPGRLVRTAADVVNEPNGILEEVP